MRLVDRQMKNDPEFRPPTEYLMAKRQNGGRPQDKVYIPVKEFPEINFFGLLVGPRGNSLKKMERESGAKISIRGKGSVKEGKGRPGGGFEDDENDELHCLVTGDSEEKVQKCVKLINGVIEIVRPLPSFSLRALPANPFLSVQAASVPEGQNDHKRNQLRELAQLNGTLRDDENQVCQNCGGTFSFVRALPTALTTSRRYWTSQVRLPRAEELDRRDHLSHLRRSWSHGEVCSLLFPSLFAAADPCFAGIALNDDPALADLPALLELKASPLPALLLTRRARSSSIPSTHLSWLSSARRRLRLPSLAHLARL